MKENLLEFREILPKDYSAIRKLLDQLSWDSYPFTTDPDLFKKLLDNTDRSVLALESSRIVGIATATCNDVSVGYVTILAVSPDKQGRGIGSQLVKILIGGYPNVKWILSSFPENEAFWEKQGFKRRRLMVKARNIDKLGRKDPGLMPKATFKTVIRNMLCKIYRLNIYKCHKIIKQLIDKTIR